MQFIQDHLLAQLERNLVIRRMPVFRNGDGTSLVLLIDKKFCKKPCDG